MGALKNFFRAVAGICETKPLDRALWRIEADQAVVLLAGAGQLQARGSAVRLESAELGVPLLVMHGPDGTYRAFINRCTHMGRRLDPAQEGQALRCCSLSHSTFDLQGAKLSGPAKGALTPLAVRHERGELYITLPSD